MRHDIAVSLTIAGALWGAGAAVAGVAPGAVALPSHPDRVLLAPGECASTVPGEQRMRWFCAAASDISASSESRSSAETAMTSDQHQLLAQAAGVDRPPSDARQELAEARAANDALQAELRSVADERQRMVSELEQQIESLREQLAVAAASAEDERAMSSELSAQLDAERADKLQAQQASAAARRELEQQLGEVRSELSAALQTNDALQADLQAGTAERQRMVSELEQRIATLQGQLAEGRESGEFLAAKLQAEAGERQRIVSQLEQQIAALQGQVAAAKTANEDARTKLTETLTLLDVERAERVQTQQASEAARRELEQQLGDARSELSAALQTNAALQADLQAGAAERQRMVSEHGQEIEVLQTRLAAADADNQDLRARLEDSLAQLDIQRAEKAQMLEAFEGERSGLERQLQEIERELSDAIDANRALQRNIETLGKENLDAFPRLAELHRQIKAYQALLGDQDLDGVVNPLDLCPQSPGGQVVDEMGCAPDREIALQEIRFDQNSAALAPDSRRLLDGLAERLNNHPDRRFEIAGHTDSSGSAELNLDISQQRAQAVKDYLVAGGVSASRLEARGYGQLRPIADNASADGRASNRRVALRPL